MYRNDKLWMAEFAKNIKQFTQHVNKPTVPVPERCRLVQTMKEKLLQIKKHAEDVFVKQCMEGSTGLNMNAIAKLWSDTVSACVADVMSKGISAILDESKQASEGQSSSSALMPASFTSTAFARWQGSVSAIADEVKEDVQKLVQAATVTFGEDEVAGATTKEAFEIVEQAEEMVSMLRHMVINFADLRVRIRDRQGFGDSFKYISRALTELDQGDICWKASTDNPARARIEKCFQHTPKKAAFFKAVRQEMKRASDEQYKSTVMGILQQQVEQPPAWLRLEGNASKSPFIAFLPFNLDALPSTSDGFRSVGELADSCRSFATAAGEGVGIAAVKGDVERTFLLAWQKLTAVRRSATELISEFCRHGYTPGYVSLCL